MLFMLPIDIANPYQLSSVIYIYIYRERHMSSFCYHNLTKFTGWAIIEELSIRRRLRIFVISWAQKTCIKNTVMLIHRHDMSSGLQ